jgi:hypothetical protein
LCCCWFGWTVGMGVGYNPVCYCLSGLCLYLLELYYGFWSPLYLVLALCLCDAYAHPCCLCLSPMLVACNYCLCWFACVVLVLWLGYCLPCVLPCRKLFVGLGDCWIALKRLGTKFKLKKINERDVERWAFS